MTIEHKGAYIIDGYDGYDPNGLLIQKGVPSSESPQAIDQPSEASDAPTKPSPQPQAE